MKFNGSLVKTKDKVIGVAVVEENFLNLEPHIRAERMMQYYRGFGEKVPVVVLISSDENKEKFFGRPDLISNLKDIPLNMMTFKSWSIPE